MKTKNKMIIIKKTLIFILLILIFFYVLFPMTSFAIDKSNLTYDEAIEEVKKNFDGVTTDEQAKEKIKEIVKGSYKDVSEDVLEEIINEKNLNGLNFRIWDEADATGGTTRHASAYVSNEYKKNYGLSNNENPFQAGTSESENGTDLDWDKLGGTLLRPFVSFVNFVADTVMKWTGKFMYPEAYDNNDDDEAIMLGAAPDLGYKNAQDFGKEIDTSNFESLTNHYYPNFRYTPEEIFSGKVDLLNIDFISGKDSNRNPIQSEGWNAIRKVVASWYKVLRMIAIIALLSVLIYTGIRIVVSANVKDKAKYKEWILNWFIAVAILFLMHYIMSFTITLINSLSNLMQSEFSGIHVTTSSLGDFTTNLIGFVRFRMLENKATVKLGYLVMYVALVWYTLKFTFIYLKRVINMAFLTLLAPIVAATYPIDKLADGQAQGFQMWIKEYIFTALLQPLHLLLYYVLVGSSIQLAATNILYGIVALKFISDAEKIFKKIFGFDKAREGMAGGLGSAFAATTVAKNLKDLARIGKGGGSGKSGNSSPSSGNIPTFTPLKDSDSDIALLGATPPSQNPQPELNGGGGAAILSIGGPGNGGAGNGTPENGSGGNGAGGGNGAQTRNPVISPGQGNQLTDRLKGLGSSALGVAKPILGGAGAVGSSALKKITGIDLNKSLGSNIRMVGGKLARGAVGVGMGATAAAVQAGISITDGKYSPWEGIAAFSGGFAGGTKLAGGLQNTFMEGYNANLPADKQRERAVNDYIHRTDVRDAVEQAFPDADKKELNNLMERIGKNYAQYGETDTKQIIKNIKNANKLSQNHGFDKDIADKQIRLINKQRSKLKEEGLLGKVLSNDAEKDNWARQMSGGDATKTQQYGALIDMMREIR